MNPITMERIGKMEYYEPHWYSAEGYYLAVGDVGGQRQGTEGGVGGLRAGRTGGSEAPDSPKWIAITEKISKLNTAISDAERELQKSYSRRQTFYDYMNNPTDKDDIKQKNKNPEKYRQKWIPKIAASEREIGKWIQNVAQAKLNLFNYQVEVGLLPPNSTPPPTPSEALEQHNATYVQGSQNDPRVIAQKQMDGESEKGASKSSELASNSRKIKIVIGIALVSILGYAIFKVVKK